jgi:hypothetical protein
LSALTSGVFTYLALTYIFKLFNIKHYKYFSMYLVAIGIFTILYAVL